MDDAFATLYLERRLNLDPDAVECAWRQLSRELHPDADTGDAERAVAVNRAYQILRSPGQRLRHWLELHGVTLSRQAAVDPAMMDFFTEVGGLLAQADDVLKRRAAASSALAKALLAEAEIVAQQQLQALLGKLQRERTAVTDRFADFEIAAAESQNFDQALAATGKLGFFEKWERQVQERLMNLIAG